VKKFVLISFLAVIFFALRLPALNSLKPEQVLGGDAEHYYLIAKNISENGVYSESGTIPSEGATWRPPVWPFVLSTYMQISDSFSFIILMKLIMELCLIIIATFIIYRIYGNSSIAIGVMCLCVIEPQFIKYSTTMLSENLSALLILINGLILLYLNKNIKNVWLHYLFGMLSGIIIITHPVAIFYILLLLSYYAWILYKSGLILKHTPVFIIFTIIVLAWPVRNESVFKQGYYITASQGATFSKGWNDSVPYLYTNTKSDLADEGLNVAKYLHTEEISKTSQSTLGLKKLQTHATLEFIKQADLTLLSEIILIKVKSNFNPFPETPKPGKIESAGSLFRLLYLLTFFFCLSILVSKHKLVTNNGLLHAPILLIVFVYIAQTFMSVAIYTGLRFNAIYSLTLVTSCFLVWLEIWKQRHYFIRK
jgi:4-amino-4-deoxy-L-arabinose transferase-like glycosyltransferase